MKRSGIDGVWAGFGSRSCSSWRSGVRCRPARRPTPNAGRSTAHSTGTPTPSARSRLVSSAFKTTHLYADTTEQPDTGNTFHKVIVTFDEGVFTQGEQLYSMGSPVTIIKASKSYLFDQERGRISKSNLSLSIRGTINSKSKKEVETADFTITMNRNWFIP